MKWTASALLVAAILLAPTGAARAQEGELPESTLDRWRAAEGDREAMVEPWLVLARGAFAWDRVSRDSAFEQLELSSVPRPVLEAALADLQRFYERNRLNDQVSRARDPHQVDRLRWFAEGAARRLRLAIATQRRAEGLTWDAVAEHRAIDGKLDVHRLISSGALFRPEAAGLPRRTLNELQRAVIMRMGSRDVAQNELARLNERIADLMWRPRWKLETLASKSVEELKQLIEENRIGSVPPGENDKVELIRWMIGRSPDEIRRAMGEAPAPPPGPPARHFTLEELAPKKVHEIVAMARAKGIEIPADLPPDRAELVRFLTGRQGASIFDIRAEIVTVNEGRSTRGARAETRGFEDILSERNGLAEQRLREARSRSRNRARRR